MSLGGKNSPATCDERGQPVRVDAKWTRKASAPATAVRPSGSATHATKPPSDPNSESRWPRRISLHTIPMIAERTWQDVLNEFCTRGKPQTPGAPAAGRRPQTLQPHPLSEGFGNHRQGLPVRVGERRRDEQHVSALRAQPGGGAGPRITATSPNCASFACSSPTELTSAACACAYNLARATQPPYNRSEHRPANDREQRDIWRLLQGAGAFNTLLELSQMVENGLAATKGSGP